MAIHPYVFLCHSSLDKPFVRKLDTSLSTLGIFTFLDEKDIKIGESIPRRIAEEIAKSTHLIYVLSEHSIHSPWVEKELDIAHVRTMESAGYRILPLLIDETEAPLEVRHLKYGDFRSWTIPEAYYLSLRGLLSALGFESPVIERQELAAYVTNLQELTTAATGIAAAFRLVDYGLDLAAIAPKHDSYLPRGYVMKVCFQRVNEIDLRESVRVVEAVIASLNSPAGTETNDALRESASIRQFMDAERRDSSSAFNHEAFDEYHAFKNSLRRLLTFLLRVTNEAQQTFLATVQAEVPN